MKKIGLYGGFLLVFVCLFFIQLPMIQGELPMKITSSAFNNGEKLPKKYTCDSDDSNPPLAWENIPPATKSLVLIVDDPDALAAKPDAWVHWIVFNIPPTITKLDENSSFDKLKGVKQGLNNNNQIKFQGACPPQGSGVHHYRFTLYALDSMLELPEGVSKQKLSSAMKGRILEQTTLMGIYERK